MQYNSNMFPYNQTNIGAMPQMPPNYPWMPSNFTPVIPNNTQGGNLQAAQNISQQMQQAFDFIPVNSFDDVKSFYVKPNERYWFRFQNDPIIALKFADSAGIAEIKYFNITEFSPQAQNNVQAQNQQFAPLEAVQQMQEKIKQLENQINEFKGANYNEQSAEQVSRTTNANTGTKSTSARNGSTSATSK